MAFLDETGLVRLLTHVIAKLGNTVYKIDYTIQVIITEMEEVGA